MEGYMDHMELGATDHELAEVYVKLSEGQRDLFILMLHEMGPYAAMQFGLDCIDPLLSSEWREQVLAWGIFSGDLYNIEN